MKAKKLAAILLMVVMVLSVMTTPALAAIPEYGQEYENQPNYSYTQTFSDVNKKHWAFEYIEEMVSRGVLSGYPNGKFYPNEYVTRGQFAKIMSVAAGLRVDPEVYSTSYSDVSPTDWFAPYVETARFYLNGYNSNGTLLYLPNDNALREDIAVALVKLKGYDTSLYDASIVKTMFKDHQSISDGAKKYVAIAVENGLISGYEDDTFRGQNGITRAEAATLLWRAYQYGSGNKVFEDEVIEEFPTKEPVIPEKEVVNNRVEVEESSDEEDVEEVGKTPEYLYEVTTVANNVNEMDMMIGDGNGTVYYAVNTNINPYINYNDAIIYEVTNGKKREVYSSKNFPIISDEEMTKAEQKRVKTKLISFGYNQNEDSLYVLVRQNQTYYFYNINTNEVLYECETSHSDMGLIEMFNYFETSNAGSGMPIVSNIAFDSNNYAYYAQYIISGDGIPTNRYNSSQGNKYQFTDNGVYKITNSFMRYLDNRTGETEEVDYYVESISSFIGMNNKHFYMATVDDEIFSVDLNGESEPVFCIDDIDIADGKKLKMDFNIDTSYVDNNGSIYFWDISYGCIRKISEL